MRATPRCARHTEEMLEDLKRQEDFALLQPAMLRFKISGTRHRGRDASFGEDQLRKLIRHLGLHHQPGFWKKHSTRDELLQACLERLRELGEVPQQRPLSPQRRRQQVHVKMKVNRERKPKKLSIFAKNSDDVSKKVGSAVTDFTGAMIYRARTLPSDVNFNSTGPSSSNESSSAIGWLRRTSIGALALSAFLGSPKVEDAPEKKTNNNEVHSQEQLGNYRQCARGLYYFTLEDDLNMMVEGGALEALREIAVNTPSLGDDADTTRYCAAAYCNLSTDADCRRLLIEGRFVTAVNALMQSSDHEVRMNCAMAVARLTEDQGHESLLVSEGFENLLVSMLTSTHDDDIKVITTKGLINLHASQFFYPLHEQVVPILTSIWCSSTRSAKKFCAYAIRNLSGDESNTRRLISSGAVASLGSLVLCDNVGDDEGVQRDCAVGFSNLACSDASHHACRDIMRWHQEKTFGALIKLAFVDDPIVKYHCALALSNLIACAERQKHEQRGEHILKTLEGFLPLATALVALTAIEVIEHIRKRIALALSCFATFNANAEILIDAKCIPALHRLVLRSGDDLELLIEVAICICNLLQNASCRQRAVKDGVVDTLALLAAKDSETVCLHVAMSFRQIATDFPLHAVVMDGGILTSLVRLCAVENVEQQCICVSCFSVMASHSKTCAQMLNDQSAKELIQTLIRMSMTSFEPTTLWCSSAFCNLSCDRSSFGLLVELGCIPYIIGMSQSGAPKIKENCAGALSNLCMHAPLSTMGLLPCLLQLQGAQSFVTKERVAQALYHLSRTVDGQRRILNASKSASVLIDAMRTGHGPTQIFTVKCICNLTSHESVVSVMVEKHLVNNFVVIALLRTQNEAIVRICAQSLYNLLSFRELRVSMIEDMGVLWALVKLGREGDPRTRKICTEALFNLSFDPEVRLGPGVIQNLANADIGCQDRETRANALGALYNLSKQARLLPFFVEEGAIAAVQRLVREEGAVGHLHKCSFILHSVSQHPPNCDKLVDPEILTTLVKLTKAADERDICMHAIHSLCSIASHTSFRGEMIDRGILRAIRPFLLSGVGERVETALVALHRMTCRDSESDFERASSSDDSSLSSDDSSSEDDGDSGNSVSQSPRARRQARLNGASPNFHDRLVEDQIISTISKVCFRSTFFPGSTAVEVCSRILSDTTLYVSDPSRVVRAGAVQIILHLLRSAPADDANDTDLHLRSASTLCVLCSLTECAARVVDDGAVEALRLIVFSPKSDPRRLRHCAAALRNICSSSEGLRALASNPDTFVILNELVRLFDDGEPLRHTVLCLCGMIADSATFKLATEHGATATLTKVASRTSDEKTKAMCHKILAAQARDIAETKHNRSASGVMALVALMRKNEHGATNVLATPVALPSPFPRRESTRAYGGHNVERRARNMLAVESESVRESSNPRWTVHRITADEPPVPIPQLEMPQLEPDSPNSQHFWQTTGSLNKMAIPAGKCILTEVANTAPLPVQAPAVSGKVVQSRGRVRRRGSIAPMAHGVNLGVRRRGSIAPTNHGRIRRRGSIAPTNNHGVGLHQRAAQQASEEFRRGLLDARSTTFAPFSEPSVGDGGRTKRRNSTTAARRNKRRVRAMSKSKQKKLQNKFTRRLSQAKGSFSGKQTLGQSGGRAQSAFAVLRGVSEFEFGGDETRDASSVSSPADGVLEASFESAMSSVANSGRRLSLMLGLDEAGFENTRER